MYYQPSSLAQQACHCLAPLPTYSIIMVYITWTIVKLVYMPIYYPQPWSLEVCC